MRRWMPLLMILAGLLVAGFYFGPDYYRGVLFKRDCRAMLAAVETGDRVKALAYIVSVQQNDIAPIVLNKVPDRYFERIDSLKLSSWERADPSTIWAIVTLRLEMDGTAGLYQGKLRWVYDSTAKRWWWDFNGSYGSAYPLSGEPDWQPLSDAIGYAGTL